MNFIIVGDKFNKIADDENIIIAKNFIKNINEGAYSFQNDIVFLGQGIKKSDLNTMVEFFVANNIGYSTCMGANKKENKRFVHKLKAKNVVITKPNAINAVNFSSMLCFSDNCEILNDHVTGLHLQGVLIVEAARQMMLSVVENFFLKDKERFNKRFTILNISSNFNQFLFPFSVEIVANIKILSSNKNKSIAEIYCDFIQNECVCATVIIKFYTHNEEFIMEREDMLAKKVISQIAKIENM